MIGNFIQQKIVDDVKKMIVCILFRQMKRKDIGEVEQLSVCAYDQFLKNKSVSVREYFLYFQRNF